MSRGTVTYHCVNRVSDKPTLKYLFSYDLQTLVTESHNHLKLVRILIPIILRANSVQCKRDFIV